MKPFQRLKAAWKDFKLKDQDGGKKNHTYFFIEN